VSDGKTLVKTFKFKNFVQAVGFVNAITPIAEAEGHHPDLCLSWGKVEASLSTHSIGGLSSKDFSLAAKLDRAYAQLAQRVPSASPQGEGQGGGEMGVAAPTDV